MTGATVHIPTLRTESLVLRAPSLADFEHRAAYYASPRAIHEGGPFDRAQAWRIFASEVGQWHLLGYGPFSVDDRATGAYRGEVGLYRPAHFPEPEVGWFVLPGAEGRGIAFEAARAVLRWARAAFGWDRLVSYIGPDNHRSLALGLRLGGVVDASLPKSDPEDVVIRHDLWAFA